MPLPRKHVMIDGKWFTFTSGTNGSLISAGGSPATGNMNPNPGNTAKVIGGIPRPGLGGGEQPKQSARVIGDNPTPRYVLKKKNGRDVYDTEVR